MGIFAKIKGQNSMMPLEMDSLASVTYDDMLFHNKILKKCRKGMNC